MDESLVCINCGSEAKPEEVDNSLKICLTCQLNLGLVAPRKERYFKTTRIKCCAFNFMDLESDVFDIS